MGREVTLLQGAGTAGTLHSVVRLIFTSSCLDYMKKKKGIFLFVMAADK